MLKSELARFIADYVMASEEVIKEAFEKDDISIVEDDAFEYLDNCDAD